MSTPKKRGGKKPGKRVLSTAFKQQRFLEEFAKHANVSAAARTTRVNRHLHYEWLGTDADYAARFAEAHKQACDAIDGEIYRRGVTGVTEPVWYQGERCGTVRRYDTTLLIFFAKGLMPLKYRDNVKAEVQVDAKIARGELDLSKLSDTELLELEGMIRRCTVGNETVDTPAATDQGSDEDPG